MNKKSVIFIIAIILILAIGIYKMNQSTKIKLETTEGDIVIELYDEMPVTAGNFEKLVREGFYDGVIFHRVIDNFMIQGGGYYQNMERKASPYGPIDLEIHPDVRHVDGAISMARGEDPDTATSEFFICDGEQSFLDDSYAAFGVVIDGIEFVRDIADDEHDGSMEPNPGGGVPEENIIINTITIENN